MPQFEICQDIFYCEAGGCGISSGKVCVVFNEIAVPLKWNDVNKLCFRHSVMIILIRGIGGWGVEQDMFTFGNLSIILF